MTRCFATILSAGLLLTGPVLARSPSPHPAPHPSPSPAPPAADPGILRFSGSDVMGGQLARDLLHAYGVKAGLPVAREELSSQPNESAVILEGPEATRRLRAEIKAHGSAEAFADLRSGNADIGMSSRPVTPVEAKALAIAHAGDPTRPGNENVISLDGVAFIVHRDNPVKALTLPRLRGLIAGTMTRWSDVGGPDGPVVVYALDPKSGTSGLVRQKVLGPGVPLVKNARIFQYSEDLADAVAADPHAIGFVGITQTRNARPVSIDNDCGLPRIAPTPFALQTEDYPLSRRLFFYVAEKRSQLVDDFLQFALSPAAQPAIQRAGFAGLDPILASDPAQAVFSPPLEARAAGAAVLDQWRAAGQALSDALAGAHRLSITFRFDIGKAMPDSRAVADLERLRIWHRQDAANRRLILIGFSSADGGFNANVALSRERAREIDALLRARDVRPAASFGVGPVNPVACETSAENANLNRRVEVWLR